MLRAKQRHILAVHPPLAEAIAKTACHFLESLNRSRQLPLPLRISAYWPIGPFEVPTQTLLHCLHQQGVHCLLPVPSTQGSLLLQFTPWKPDTRLVKGPLGTLIPEKTQPSLFKIPHVMFLPLLAYDQQGYRLGRGGGYYDTTLQTFRKNTPDFLYAAGLAHPTQAVPFVPREHHDQKMDALVLEKEWIWLKDQAV